MSGKPIDDAFTEYLKAEIDFMWQRCEWMKNLRRFSEKTETGETTKFVRQAIDHAEKSLGYLRLAIGDPFGEEESDHGGDDGTSGEFEQHFMH